MQTKTSDKIIAYAKLPLQLDLQKARGEIARHMCNETPHFNTAHYTGEWTVVSLRSPAGKPDNIIPDLLGGDVYLDTTLLHQCSAIKNFLDAFECPIMSVRLLNLKPNASIKEHRDADLSYENGEARLHIPLFTNKQVEFFVQGEQVIMNEGECWYINANLPHRVANFGSTDRIHLVIDCKVSKWLQDIFNTSVKAFAKFEAVDNQMSLIIKELRNQNTETSNSLADKLQQQQNAEATKSNQQIFPYWLPYKLNFGEPEILLEWLFTGNIKFTDPFFDETISKCKRLPENSKSYKSVSNFSILEEWTNHLDSVEPTALIFHVSRCGSTLLSQVLGLNEENISLSEVPLFDEILRLSAKGLDDCLAGDFLTQVITFYGARKTGLEKRMFIKTDSWHLLFYDKLRELYPATPFIIIYREPTEVIFSQQRQKGIHAVRGLVEASLFGFAESDFDSYNPEEHISLVLEKYFETILKIVADDKNVLLLNYNEGITRLMEKIAAFINMNLTDDDRQTIANRSRYHAKNSQEIFEEKYPANEIVTPNLATLKELYTRVQTLRGSV